MKFSRSALNPSSGRSGDCADREVDYFFLDTDAERDPAVRQLQDAIVGKLPAIRDHIRRTVGDDSLLTDYVDRLYKRLRRVSKSTALTEESIWSRLVSIVHEERRRDRRRFVSVPENTPLEAHADPSGLDFLTDLIRRDEFRAFRDCLDDWTRRALDVRFSAREPLKSKDLAKRFKMKPNTFDQRWKRGLDAGLAEFRRRHGA